MDEIQAFLEKIGYSSSDDSGFTIISLFGVSESKSEVANVHIANRIVGQSVFSFIKEPLKKGTIEIAYGLQMYVEKVEKIVYFFMDSTLDSKATLSNQNHHSNTTRGLLLLLTISHLVVPILPPSLLPSEFLTTLVSLAQVKQNMYTHLAQFQASCWKYWNINVPNALFEKREFDRSSSNLMGWWGPAKGVPLLVFVASGIPFSTIEPVAIRKMQDHLQDKIKQLFRALHLVPNHSGPSKSENSSNAPVEVRSLFLLPSTSQPIIHIIPAKPKEEVQLEQQKQEFSFLPPISLSDYLEKEEEGGDTQKQPQSEQEHHYKRSQHLQHDYGHRLLKNFVTIWQKTATTRHPMHSHHHHHHHRSNNRANDSKTTPPLPNPIQFISALVILLCFIFQRPTSENGVDFRQIIIQPFPSTKGMMHQIEVILRKKITDHVEIERTFSKHQCLGIMKKANLLYLQDSPPYYTEQYHLWKLNNVLRVYRSLSRGPCLEEYASRLEKECDQIWRNDRQGCENISLSGNPCRLKIGHQNEPASPLSRDSMLVHGNKHNSGVTFIHACNCGKSQMSRDDPFDITDANINFYLKFDCCLEETSRAVDIEKSTFGNEQKLSLNQFKIPPYDITMLYLGPAELYRPGVGLDRVEGFMNSTKRLILWSLGTIADLKIEQQQQQQQQQQLLQQANNEKQQQQQPVVIIKKSNDIEWPELGKATPTTNQHDVIIATPNTASLEAFPALGKAPPPPPQQQQQQQQVLRHATPVTTTTTTPTTATVNMATTSIDRRGRRRRGDRKRRRPVGIIRGYIGAEYECPHGHRFMSCGDGRVCKVGHASHPKEHGQYFVHQDLPIYILCPCTYANGHSSVANTEVVAQLQRLYAVTPDEPITMIMEPKIKMMFGDKEITLDFGITEGGIRLGPNGFYVLRLPFIYRDEEGSPIPIDPDVQKRLKSAVLLKDCFKFQHTETEKWV